MKATLAEQAMYECRCELEAACRLEIDAEALNQIYTLLKPQFEKLLKGDAGVKAWARDGEPMRTNGRFMGAFAEYFADRQRKQRVGFAELFAALLIVQVKCIAGVPEHGREYCEDVAGIPPENDETRAILASFVQEVLKDVLQAPSK